MEILYLDNKIIVCVKPVGVLSTDEPGGMPSLLRAALGDDAASVYAVHRLDAAVSGVMVYARTRHAAADLGRAIERGDVRKEYLAVACGELPAPSGELRDLLWRDRKRRKTFVAEAPGKDVREAILHYETLQGEESLSLVRIRLETGRTHQIRAQFSARGLPLWGDRKYSLLQDGGAIALWSHALEFTHPVSGMRMEFRLNPPLRAPWERFFAPHRDET